MNGDNAKIFLESQDEKKSWNPFLVISAAIFGSLIAAAILAFVILNKVKTTASEVVNQNLQPIAQTVSAEDVANTRAAEREEMKAELRAGNVDYIETYLNISIKSRAKKTVPCTYKCGNVNGSIIVIAKNKPCRTFDDARFGIYFAALEIGELLAMGAPISRAESQVITESGQMGAVTLPLKDCKALAMEREALGEFTYGSFDEFCRKSDISSISALHLPTEEEQERRARFEELSAQAKKKREYSNLFNQRQYAASQITVLESQNQVDEDKKRNYATLKYGRDRSLEFAQTLDRRNAKINDLRQQIKTLDAQIIAADQN